MKTIFIISTLIAAIQLNAQNLGGNFIQNTSVNGAFPFLSIVPDAKSSGLGFAGTASSSSANSIYWNTAGSALSENKACIAFNYSPYLRSLISDFHYGQVGGFAKIGKNANHVIGGSIQFLSHPTISFDLDPNNPESSDSQMEFAATGSYAYKISEKHAVGINTKFIYSNLKSQQIGGVSGIQEVNPGTAGAIDLSYKFKQELKFFKRFEHNLSLANSLSNLGSRPTPGSAYSSGYLVTGFRTGMAYSVKFSEKHQLLFAADIDKPLRPSSWADESAIEGVIRSFNDAEGGIKGEIKEFGVGGGLEYTFNNFITARSGYYREDPSLSNRRFITAGAGVKVKSFFFDYSHLISLTSSNPEANSMRFTLGYEFD